LNPKFATLTCLQEAASTAWREDGKATTSWSNQHSGDGWYNNYYYDAFKKLKPPNGCERDEYPPAYLMNAQDPASIDGGNNIKGQMVRVIPANMNGAGGKLWKSICFLPLLEGLQLADLRRIVDGDKNKKTVATKGITQTYAISRHHSA
jgi:hypothetical protein